MTDTTAAFEVTPDGYGGGRYPAARRMGQFSRLQVGGFQVVPEDQVVTRSYFGLPHTDTWFDAFLTTASGKYYVISHDVWSNADGSLSPAGLLGALEASPDGLVADTRYEQWAGAITQKLTADGRILYAVPGATRPEEVGFDGTSLEWKSANGDLHIRGPLAGGGTQWHHAWRRPDDETGEMFYNQQGYSVDGTYFDEPVTGHVIIETMWGNEHYMETWWVQNRVGHWASFAIDYDDGSSEFGQFLCGEYGARGAVVVDDLGREVVSTTNINAVDHPDGRIEYELGGGEQWEITVEPSRALTFPRTRLGFGVARRVDERRRVVKATATYLIADRIAPPEPFR
jgi:hypothetical protein